MLWLFFLQNGKPSSATSLVFPVLYQVQKAFGKYGWKIKKNTTFWVVPVENGTLRNEKSEKVVLFYRMECFGWKFLPRVPFLQSKRG